MCTAAPRICSRCAAGRSRPAHRQEAERTLRDAAVEAGILQRARGSAERTLRTLLNGLGFDHVQVSFSSE